MKKPNRRGRRGNRGFRGKIKAGRSEIVISCPAACSFLEEGWTRIAGRGAGSDSDSSAATALAAHAHPPAADHCARMRAPFSLPARHCRSEDRIFSPTSLRGAPKLGAPLCRYWSGREDSNFGSLALTPRHWLRTPIRLRRTAAHACVLRLGYLRAIAARKFESSLRQSESGTPWFGAPLCRYWSGREDSNFRPLGPEPSALPG